MTTLKIGDIAPNFKVKDENGKLVQLSDFKGQKVILFFYPRDNTPTCTVEACNLRDNYELLVQKGYVIIGISPDSEKKHQNFIAKHELPFPLLSDTERTMVEDYGVWGPKKFMGKVYDGLHRTTFVIDEHGKISQVIKKVKSKEHAAQILALEEE